MEGSVRIVNLGGLHPPPFTDDMLEKLAEDLTEQARVEWGNIAEKELHSSVQDYQHGITRTESNRQAVARVALVGPLPNMIENGAAPFDLRDTLLSPNAPKAHKIRMSHGRIKKASGTVYVETFRYRVIAFRHRTPTASRRGGTPMGFRYRNQRDPRSRAARPDEAVQDWRKLGRAIYRKASKLDPGESLPEGVASVPKLLAHHSTDLYAGMIRGRQPLEGGGEQGAGYYTFRTISTKNTVGWRHPGIEARHLAAKVQDFIMQRAPRVIDGYLRGAGNA